MTNTAAADQAVGDAVRGVRLPNWRMILRGGLATAVAVASVYSASFIWDGFVDGKNAEVGATLAERYHIQEDDLSMPMARSASQASKGKDNDGYIRVLAKGALAGAGQELGKRAVKYTAPIVGDIIDWLAQEPVIGLLDTPTGFKENQDVGHAPKPIKLKLDDRLVAPQWFAAFYGTPFAGRKTGGTLEIGDCDCKGMEVTVSLYGHRLELQISHRTGAHSHAEGDRVDGRVQARWTTPYVVDAATMALKDATRDALITYPGDPALKTFLEEHRDPDTPKG